MARSWHPRGKNDLLIFNELIDLKEDGSFKLNMEYFNYLSRLTITSEAFHQLFGGPPRELETKLTQKGMDLARSVQVVCEEVMLGKARGLLKILGEAWDRLAEVPESEIMAIQKVHGAGLPVRPYPYLREGQRVRITEGLLAGSEGILLRTKPNKGLLVVSVNLLQRSVAVEVDGTLVVPA